MTTLLNPDRSLQLILHLAIYDRVSIRYVILDPSRFGGRWRGYGTIVDRYIIIPYRPGVQLLVISNLHPELVFDDTRIRLFIPGRSKDLDGITMLSNPIPLDYGSSQNAIEILSQGLEILGWSKGQERRLP